MNLLEIAAASPTLVYCTAALIGWFVVRSTLRKKRLLCPQCGAFGRLVELDRTITGAKSVWRSQDYVGDTVWVPPSPTHHSRDHGPRHASDAYFNDPSRSRRSQVLMVELKIRCELGCRNCRKTSIQQSSRVVSVDEAEAAGVEIIYED